MIGIPVLAAPFGAMSWVLRIGSVGVAISSLESLLRRADLGPGGLLDGEAQLTRARWLLPLAFLAPVGRAVVITGIRLAAACALIAGAGNFEVARAGAVVIAATTLLLRFRSPLGIHASGSMVMVTFTAAALGMAVGTRLALNFTLGFIAAQACLAYFVAGAAKLAEPSWRSGRAIPLISSTLMWGNGAHAAVLNSHRRLALALCWVTMLGECSVPLALVVPLPAAFVILGLAGFFHVLTAIEMGLNSFVWAFGSTYPAIIFCWYWLHGARP
jgi:hypothetical protein